MGREPRLPPHALRVALASRAGLGQILRGGARAWEAWLPHVVPRVGRLLRVLLLLKKKRSGGRKLGLHPSPPLMAVIRLLSRPHSPCLPGRATAALQGGTCAPCYTCTYGGAGPARPVPVRITLRGQPGTRTHTAAPIEIHEQNYDHERPHRSHLVPHLRAVVPCSLHRPRRYACTLEICCGTLPPGPSTNICVYVCMYVCRYVCRCLRRAPREAQRGPEKPREPHVCM